MYNFFFYAAPSTHWAFEGYNADSLGKPPFKVSGTYFPNHSDR